jgi:hypothetical protein
LGSRSPWFVLSLIGVVWALVFACDTKYVTHQVWGAGKARDRDCVLAAYYVWLPANLRCSSATPQDCLFGCGRQSVDNSTLCSAIWSAADATHDDVERNRDGQSAAAMHRASRRLQPSPGLALLSRFHQPRLAFCASLPIRPPAPNSQHSCE